MRKKDRFFILGLVVLFVLVIIIGYIIVMKDPCIVSFSSTNLTTLLGVIISSISIVITAFFVVLAIDAYGKIREIKNDAKDVYSMRNTAVHACRGIGKTSLTCYDCTLNTIEITLSFLNRRYLDEKDKKALELYKKWREDYKRKRARLGLSPFLFEDNIRQELILNLASSGKREDIQNLEDLCNSRNESDVMKSTAKMIIEELKKKYDDI